MKNFLLHCIDFKQENNGILYGHFQIAPFTRGEGITFANILRRTLLSELNGLSIICVEIQGVNHEYANLKGVRESVLDILLNLRQIVFTTNKKFIQPEIGFLKIQGPAVVKARDLKLPSFLTCVNPNHNIATLSDNACLEMKFMICEGKNFPNQKSFGLIQEKFYSYFSNSGQDKSSDKYLQKLFSNNENVLSDFLTRDSNFESFENYFSLSNLLFLDSTFMPVIKVNFSIQNVKKFSRKSHLNFPNSNGEKKFFETSFQEKINLEIWTNGSIQPYEALFHATQKIIKKFSLFQKTFLNTKKYFNDKPTTKNFKLFKNDTFYLKKNLTPTSTTITSPFNTIYQPWRVQKNIHLPLNLNEVNDETKIKTNKKKINRNFLNMDIIQLDLPIKLYLCLKRSNIHTINDIVQCSAHDLLKLRNFGRKSLHIVETALSYFNFKLLPEQLIRQQLTK